jgi:hypothetical protein
MALANIALQMRQCGQIDSHHGSSFGTRIPKRFPSVVIVPLSSHRWLYRLLAAIHLGWISGRDQWFAKHSTGKSMQ